MTALRQRSVGHSLKPDKCGWVHIIQKYNGMKLISPGIFNWISSDQELAQYTTWKIGGAAQYFAVVKTLNMLLEALAAAKEYGLPVYILGGGSNLLIDDAGIPGLVIKLEGDFKQSQPVSPRSIQVGAGLPMPILSNNMAAAGFTGFEFMVGIPGSIGGGIVMNAGRGAGGTCMSSILKSVRYIDETLTENEVGVEALEMAYRSTRLKNQPAIVVSAEFNLGDKDDPQAIQNHLQSILDERKAKFPLNYPNAGSVFKRPKGPQPAGWLIEHAGLKGRRIGNAQISPIHANFIVNLGGASSADAKSLIALAQEEVFKTHGILLEKEVVYWPEETTWNKW
jgi:UDP-N-acetylmuramate dehydrogenase